MTYRIDVTFEREITNDLPLVKEAVTIGYPKWQALVDQLVHELQALCDDGTCDGFFQVTKVYDEAGKLVWQHQP